MYLLYFVLWIIFNGAVTTEICIFGLVIAGVIFAFTCRFMDYSVKKRSSCTGAFSKCCGTFSFWSGKSSRRILQSFI